MVKVTKLAAVANVWTADTLAKNKNESKDDETGEGVMKKENSEKRGSVTLIMIMIITTAPTLIDVVIETGIVMAGLTIMIGTTTTIVMIQEVMVAAVQTRDKVMIIIMKIGTARGATALLAIMAEVARANMDQRNQVSAVIVGVAETVIETIGIIENRHEVKGRLGAMKRKNKKNLKGTCHECGMMMEIVKMVVMGVMVDVNLIKVNIMFHQYQVLRIFIPQVKVEVPGKIRLHH